MKTILDLCGGTGAWSRPYDKAGYDVRVITLPDHDVRTYIPPSKVYGVLAAPPCTNLAVSGAWTWNKKGKEGLVNALALVDACLRIVLVTRPKFWVLENPVGRLVNYLGKPRMYFNPYEYAGYLDDPTKEAYTKKTCLWGDFNPPLKLPIKDFKSGYNTWIEKLGGKSERTKRLRSITPSGFTKAFFEANR